MERLTRFVGYRNDYPVFILNKSELRGRPSSRTITALADRLGLYENTELTPEEISAMKSENERLITSLKILAENQHGRSRFE